MSKEHPPHHIPVLLDATLNTLNPQAGESYLDLTAGYGGHAGEVLKRTENLPGSVLVDRDDYAIQHLSKYEDKGVRLMHTDFESAARQLIKEGRAFDVILIDLGVSSPQLDQGERGFSFKNTGPLDMRMDRRQALTAHELIQGTTVEELAKIIHEYGEERYMDAKRIAELIIANRPFTSTEALAHLIAEHHRGKWGHIHPATRTFQALRIAVNDELGHIERTLPLLPKLLHKGGRVGVISFHSLEDRLVKRFFKDQFELGLEAELAPITKKPITGAAEDVHNPRARSAKLRVAVKK
ncbi:MAG: 16S rRNA (cytosine(1402)-N(4))-methyltransferase RsmH [Candidatus Microsaccharimonas sossegonensis]|uniref:Ribosomal RNA small subunit methyltransferase H n=1 Tax=Candidatus Microsaccharimonas sossegonensis TaxID=2506948 RepID=A0A4Q0AHM8_9BACT|nr:MAG: 16S rRNA (cytosine(1402)-N(4))-methyltransferase RsmH [Candidatus Microsaccharimonas sossegonensis]